eukprot:Hpha_TRINITY_DN16236_c2_g6::TRINITY_DN16236_c2_g6_i1::g.14661::m.14661
MSGEHETVEVEDKQQQQQQQQEEEERGGEPVEVGKEAAEEGEEHISVARDLPPGPYGYAALLAHATRLNEQAARQGRGLVGAEPQRRDLYAERVNSFRSVLRAGRPWCGVYDERCSPLALAQHGWLWDAKGTVPKCGICNATLVPPSGGADEDIGEWTKSLQGRHQVYCPFYATACSAIGTTRFDWRQLSVSKMQCRVQKLAKVLRNFPWVPGVDPDACSSLLAMEGGVAALERLSHRCKVELPTPLTEEGLSKGVEACAFVLAVCGWEAVPEQWRDQTLEEELRQAAERYEGVRRRGEWWEVQCVYCRQATLVERLRPPPSAPPAKRRRGDGAASDHPGPFHPIQSHLSYCPYARPQEYRGRPEGYLRTTGLSTPSRRPSPGDSFLRVLEPPYDSRELPKLGVYTLMDREKEGEESHVRRLTGWEFAVRSLGGEHTLADTDALQRYTERLCLQLRGLRQQNDTKLMRDRIIRIRTLFAAAAASILTPVLVVGKRPVRRRVARNPARRTVPSPAAPPASSPTTAPTPLRRKSNAS